MENIMKQSKYYVLLLLVSCLISVGAASDAGEYCQISFSFHSLMLHDGFYPLRLEYFASDTTHEVLWQTEVYSDSLPLFPILDGNLDYHNFFFPRAVLRGLSDVWVEASYLDELIAPRTEVLIDLTSELLESEVVGIEIGLGTEETYIASAKTGIGTSTPAEVLDVVGNVKATAFYGDGAQLTQIYNLDANDANPQNALYVDNSGWVGVGTTAPTTNLSIVGDLRLGSCTTCNSSTEGALRYNSTSKVIEFCNGTAWVQFGATGSKTTCVYRWCVWSNYCQWNGWFNGNCACLTAGVAPSQWADGGYRAYQMSSEKSSLLALFAEKGYAKSNALIYVRQMRYYSSTDARFVGVLLRIKNNNTSAVNWTPYVYYTCYGSWTNYASGALNGVEFFVDSSNRTTCYTNAWTLSLPASRTSTVIILSSFDMGCSCCQYYAAIGLSFYNNSLNLPTGCEYVDDMNTAADGWSY
jgi:hypothetical protein